MARPRPDRTVLLSALADHVLEEGLNTASLRPMAAAAGMSDRMLLYHFGSKDALVAALLEHLAAQARAGLDAALPPVPFESEGDLVAAVVGLLRSEPFRPYVRVWLDIVSAAAQGGADHRRAGGTIMDAYLDWIALRHPGGRDAAPRVLALVEGVLVLDAVGRSDIADAAAGGPTPPGGSGGSRRR